LHPLLFFSPFLFSFFRCFFFPRSLPPPPPHPIVLR
jgi:hypothetical protein